MRRIHFPTVLTLSLAFTFLAVTALGGDIYQNHGQTVSAYFVTVDPQNGCISVRAYVSADWQKPQNPPGPGSFQTSAGVSVYKVNTCGETWTYLVEASGGGPIPAKDLTIKPHSASLKTTIMVTDYISGSSELYPVTIDLVWTTTGPPERRSYHDHFHSQHINQTFYYNGTYSPADAVGTVMYEGMNFAPDTSFDADLGKGRIMGVNEDIMGPGIF